MTLLVVLPISENAIPSNDRSMRNPSSCAELSFQARLIWVVEMLVADSPLGAIGCAELTETFARSAASANQMDSRRP